MFFALLSPPSPYVALFFFGWMYNIGTLLVSIYPGVPPFRQCVDALAG
jgi:hypothetical protein